MRHIVLESMHHYKLTRDNDKGCTYLMIYGHPDDLSACPGMGDRGEFKPEEGRVKNIIWDGEEVMISFSPYIIKGSEELTKENDGLNGWPRTIPKGGIFCGDDLAQFLGLVILEQEQKEKK